MTRPPLSPTLTGAEFRRWYWTLQELQGLARDLGVPRGGGKQVLAERLAEALDGRPPPRAAPPPRRARTGHRLEGPLTTSTVLPEGQPCSQALRAFFREQIGPGFTFDAAMRAFVAAGAGRTLGEAVEHWHATRGEASRPRPIAPQFELNTFLRRWREAHPGAPREEALRAWRVHRSLPVDERRPLPERPRSG